ncbi:hypothetical protein ACFQ0B_59650 [Nonomuraea thailandensis]
MLPGSNPPSGRSHTSSRPDASSAASTPAWATGSSPDLNATARHNGVPGRPCRAAVPRVCGAGGSSTVLSLRLSRSLASPARSATSRARRPVTCCSRAASSTAAIVRAVPISSPDRSTSSASPASTPGSSWSWVQPAAQSARPAARSRARSSRRRPALSWASWAVARSSLAWSRSCSAVVRRLIASSCRIATALTSLIWAARLVTAALSSSRALRTAASLSAPSSAARAVGPDGSRSAPALSVSS